MNKLTFEQLLNEHLKNLTDDIKVSVSKWTDDLSCMLTHYCCVNSSNNNRIICYRQERIKTDSGHKLHKMIFDLPQSVVKTVAQFVLDGYLIYGPDTNVQIRKYAFVRWIAVTE